MPDRPARRPAAHVHRPLVVAPGEIVGLVTLRREVATPLLLDVATRAMRDGTPALVLDMPLERMDHEARVVAGAIARSAAHGGAAVVVVAHRQATLAHLAQRVLVLDADGMPAPADGAASVHGGVPLH